MDADIYGLFGDEPSAQEKAAALVQLLRQRQGAAAGDRRAAGVFSIGANPLAAGLVRQANANADAAGQEVGQLQQFLGQAGQQRAQHVLQRALQTQQQQFQGGQNAAELEARAKEGRFNRGIQREQMANALTLQEMRDRGDLAERQLQVDAAKAKALEKQREDLEKNTTDLRKEFHSLPQTKRIIEVNEARKKIETATPDGAGDLGLVYGYMKLLDPGSSVKEGEFANASKTEGIPGQILALRSQILAQGLLPPEARAALKRESAKIYAAHLQSFQPTLKAYSDLAQQRNIDPGQVVYDMGLDPGGAPQRTPTSGFNLDEQPQKKTINGKTYTFENGQWMAEE